jgi:hypothetical protein
MSKEKASSSFDDNGSIGVGLGSELIKSAATTFVDCSDMMSKVQVSGAFEDNELNQTTIGDGTNLQDTMEMNKV